MHQPSGTPPSNAKSLLRWLGPSRYTVSSIIEILLRKNRHATLIVDGKKLVNNFTFVVACNSIHIGKGMKMAPDAKLNDGKMDIILIEDNFNKLELLKLFPTLFAGEHIKNDKVNYLQANSLKLQPKKDDILNIDVILSKKISREEIGYIQISIDKIQNSLQSFHKMKFFYLLSCIFCGLFEILIPNPS